MDCAGQWVLDREPAVCRGGRGWARGAAFGVVLALGGAHLVARLHAADWWAAKGGDGGLGAALGWVALGMVAVAAVLAAVERSARVPRGWPRSALLLVTALVMQPIGQLLTFGFRDSALGVGWVCVELIVLGAVVVLEARRPRVLGLVAIAWLATATFAASLLAVTPLA